MFKAIIIVAASLTGAQAAGSGLRHHQLESVNKGFNLDRHPLYSSIAKEAKKAEVGAAVEASFVEASSGWGHWNPWYWRKKLEAAAAKRKSHWERATAAAAKRKKAKAWAAKFKREQACALIGYGCPYSGRK